MVLVEGYMTFTPNFLFATGPIFGTQFEFFRFLVQLKGSVCDRYGIGVLSRRWGEVPMVNFKVVLITEFLFAMSSHSGGTLGG